MNTKEKPIPKKKSIGIQGEVPFDCATIQSRKRLSLINNIDG